MNYTDYVTTMSNLMVVKQDDANFVQILPQMITSAEQRIYRDLDLISTVVTDASGSMTQGSRNVSISSAFVVVQNINVLSANNARSPLTPQGRAYIDTVWNDPTVMGVPIDFAMVTQSTLIVGPVPNAPYTIEVIGTQRPATLSSTTSSTFISTNLPDLFVAASMIFGSGYLKNFGSMADNPQMAVSWDAQYQELLKAANIEELRKKQQSQAWSNQFPTPAAPAQG